METFLALVNIVFIAVFCWWYWRKQELPVRKFYWHGVAAKLSAGLLVGIIYAVAYDTSDTHSMFAWAKELTQLARTDVGEYFNHMWYGEPAGYFPGSERSHFFVKIVSLFALLTYDNYWICALYFSLLSFLAAWRLTKLIWTNFPIFGIPAAIAFLFFPSCVFWASGIIKESLAMTGLYLLAALFLQVWWRQRVSIFDAALALLMIWIVWNLKYHYVGLFVPVLLAVWVTRKIVEWRKYEKFDIALFFSLVLIFVLGASLLHPNLSLARIPGVLVSNNQISMQASSPDNVIGYYQLTDSWLSIILNSPWAVLSGIFRPFLWEANTFLKFFVAVEGLVLLVLSVVSIRSVLEIKTSPHRLLLVATLTYCIVLCAFLAISTPNLGTLVRYRVGFLPFLLMLVMSRPFIVRGLAKLFNVHIEGLPR